MKDVCIETKLIPNIPVKWKLGNNYFNGLTLHYIWLNIFNNNLKNKYCIYVVFLYIFYFGNVIFFHSLLIYLSIQELQYEAKLYIALTLTYHFKVLALV